MPSALKCLEDKEVQKIKSRASFLWPLEINPKTTSESWQCENNWCWVDHDGRQYGPRKLYHWREHINVTLYNPCHECRHRFLVVKSTFKKRIFVHKNVYDWVVLKLKLRLTSEQGWERLRRNNFPFLLLLKQAVVNVRDQNFKFVVFAKRGIFFAYLK